MTSHARGLCSLHGEGSASAPEREQTLQRLPNQCLLLSCWFPWGVEGSLQFKHTHLKQVQQICLKRQIKCICIFKIVVSGYITIVLFQKINVLPNSKQWYQLTTHQTFFILFLFGWSDGVLLKEVASHLFPLCPMTDQSQQSDLCSWTYLRCSFLSLQWYYGRNHCQSALNSEEHRKATGTYRFKEDSEK